MVRELKPYQEAENACDSNWEYGSGLDREER